jgi:hypothetical protein
MTRSRLAEGRGLRLAWLAALPVVAASACSGRSMSLGGDPLALSVGATSGIPTGAAGTLSPGTGGTTGGVGGTIGGTGGVVIPVGGNGGTAAEAATGGAEDNPYPPVTWQNGQGYRDVCPEYDDISGFTCWHYELGAGTTCGVDGSPTCNACSCAIPCDEPGDCPAGPQGELAVCLGSDTNVRSCFLACEEGDCPLGMECSNYPGGAERACLWVEQSRGMGTPAK